MALNMGLRSSACKLLTSTESFLSKSKSVKRGFHSSGVKRMGGHGHDDAPFWEHSKHMYNLDMMQNRTLKMSLSVFTAFSIGVGVPVFATVYQLKKAASA